MIEDTQSRTVFGSILQETMRSFFNKHGIYYTSSRIK